MTSDSNESGTEREPQGFSEHTRKSPSENAHQQGWGLNQEERTRLPEGKQATDGGTDYDYGAQDFGDTPVDTSAAQPVTGTMETADAFRGPQGTDNPTNPDEAVGRGVTGGVNAGANSKRDAA